MIGLGRVSPTNGSVHGVTRRSVSEIVRIYENEDEVHVLNEDAANVMRGANEGVYENLLDVGDGVMNGRVNGNVGENRQVARAYVHAAPPSTAALTVSRWISPFDSQV